MRKLSLEWYFFLNCGGPDDPQRDGNQFQIEQGNNRVYLGKLEWTGYRNSPRIEVNRASSSE